MFRSFPWVLTAATEVLKVVLWKAGVKASFSAVPCPAGRLHSWNSAWDNERVVNYSYGNPHGFCYRSCYCTQAAQDKMGLSFSQKERQSSDSHSQNQSCSTSELFPVCRFLLHWLRDFQVYFFLVLYFRNAKLQFWNWYFLFNMPSQLSAWDYKWKCTGILGEKCFSV